MVSESSNVKPILYYGNDYCRQTEYKPIYKNEGKNFEILNTPPFIFLEFLTRKKLIGSRIVLDFYIKLFHKRVIKKIR